MRRMSTINNGVVCDCSRAGVIVIVIVIVLLLECWCKINFNAFSISFLVPRFNGLDCIFIGLLKVGRLFFD